MLKQKILIVDDDHILRNIYTELLSEDYELQVVESGNKALEVIFDFKPDMVILDIMMPGMNGYEVCRAIRNNGKLRCTKVVFVSAKAMVQERLTGYEWGADDYITKPFNENELLAKVRILIKLKYAEEVNVLKSAILELFSHETRTPLNGIIGFARILKEESALSEDGQGFVQSIIDCGMDLFRFVEKISLLCELKKGISLSPVSLPVSCLIDDTIQYIKSIQSGSDVSFSRANKAKDPITVTIDKELMGKALLHVLENAIRFSPPNGVISVTTDIVDGYCAIRVSDQGKGIREGLLEEIFDEFAISDIMHHQKGQGLSLAISRAIARSHGGNLVAGNNEGGGAGFIFTLPV